jgi:pyruvate,water dikinase
MALLDRILHRRKQFSPMERLHGRMDAFRSLVERNNKVLQLIADAGEKLGGEYVFDSQYLKTSVEQLQQEVRGVVYDLEVLTANAFPELAQSFQRIQAEIQDVLVDRISIPKTDYVIPLQQINGEMAEAVGQKMARLAEIGTRLGCRVPHGFVVTTWACQTFFEQAGLLPLLNEWSKLEANGAPERIQKAAELKAAVMAASVPRVIQKAILAGLKKLRKESSFSTLAIRSSAPGEDGSVSFAGLYTTQLGVPFEAAVNTYREIVASLFSPIAIKYRKGAGVHPAQAMMAVGYQCLVEARAAGVLYTLDPTAPEINAIVISAITGLGKPVVDGTSSADRMIVSREFPHHILSSSIAQKGEMLSPSFSKGLVMEEVPADQRDKACLDAEEIGQLAHMALQIEQYSKRAQDIEWAVDKKGNIFILQARPLQLNPARREKSRPAVDPASNHRVLMRSAGAVACSGIGAGPVVIVDEDLVPEDIQQGAVLVARASSPRLSGVMIKSAAVITDLGTSTGHLATIARELRVPMIVGTQDATRVLRNAVEVTVDAEDNIVYEGIVGELIHDQLLAYSGFEEAREFQLLRRLLKKIAPLTLNDPQSSGFRAENCKSYHDIIRFAHEKAVQCLTEGSCLEASQDTGPAKRLEMNIPLDLIILDLGGGVKPTSTLSKTIRIEDIASEPLRPLIEGLLTPGIWSREPVPMDLDGFMASATRSELSTVAGASQSTQRNLAVISDHYLHLNLMLGYHFNIIDCYLSSKSDDNFIYFRFAGGVTEMMRRTRRAQFLASILEKHDFLTERKGDLIIARLKKFGLPEMVDRLHILGKLIGFTRQLDVSLRDDLSVDSCINRFMEGDYKPI